MSEEKIKQAIRAYKIIAIAQYAAPFILIVLAIVVSGMTDIGQSKTMIVGLLYVFAVVDFLFLRFAMLPKLRANLDKLTQGQS